MTHTKPLIPDVPFHPGPTYRHPPKPIRSNMPRSQESSQSSTSVDNINPDINLDFKENFTVSRRCNFGDILKIGQNILSRPKRIK